MVRSSKLIERLSFNVLDASLQRVVFVSDQAVVRLPVGGVTKAWRRSSSCPICVPVRAEAVRDTAVGMRLAVRCNDAHHHRRRTAFRRNNLAARAGGISASEQSLRFVGGRRLTGSTVGEVISRARMSSPAFIRQQS